MPTTNQLITKYRPITFEEVLGNEVAVKTLIQAVRGNLRPHAFLLSGMTGVGKTTLARIIAKEVNAYIIEKDAASNSGVDEVRQMILEAGFTSVMGALKNKMYIIDECHNLSKKAFEPILKWIEDPPEFIYVCLCTTEPAALPKALINRCFPVSLKPLKSQEIEGLIQTISDLEQWTLTNDVFAAIVQASEGSARKALRILEAAHSLKTREELAKVVVEVETEDSPAIALANFLLRGGRDWKQVSKMLEQIEEKIEDFEVASTQMNRCFANAMARGANGQAQTAWQMMNCFTGIQSWDPKIRLFSAVGKIIFSQ